MAAVSRKDLWDSAGRAGLVLGLVSTAYMIISLLLARPTGGVGITVFASLVSMVLWAAKFIGCILLMKYFMKKFCRTYPDATNGTSFRFGMCVALLSALIYSGCFLAYYSLIAPEALNDTLDTALASYSNMLDSNSLQAVEAMKENYVTVSFFTNLVYCFVFGTFLSSILSRDIPSRDPFADIQTPEDQ